jgi:protocatechuate 3,4-dioxygenase alpha subunit
MPIPTSSQTIGPFFREGLNRPTWADLTRDGASGTPIRIVGSVLDGEGLGVPDALLEAWQADAHGRFADPQDTRAGTPDPHFRGFGRSCTDPEGAFAFRTIRPGAVPSVDGGLQAPHINLTVFARGLLKRLVTRIYFSDLDEANAIDPLLRSIADAGVRATLIAQRAADLDGEATYYFNVVLQGEGETAFLAV